MFIDKIEILKDLEDIYRQAMEKGNFTVALKVKELLGKELGLFTKDAKARNGRISLGDLSDDDIAALIADLENQLALDHSKEEG